jgi:two-component system response regulator LytT
MPEPALLRVGIIDDDQGALSIIKASVSSILNDAKIPFEITSFFNSDSLLNPHKDTGNDFDLLFCDIEMPGLDGIQVAGIYQQKHPAAAIVFISNREDRVFDSLKVHPFGFIRKRNFLDDIKSLMNSYFKSIKEKENEPSILFSYETSYTRVLLKNIIFIESEKKNQFVHIKGRPEPLKIASSMKKLCDDLEDKGFIYCHKAFLVNYKYIKVIEKDIIRLTDGSSVYLSRRKITEVKEKYLSLVQNEKNIVF